MFPNLYVALYVSVSQPSLHDCITIFIHIKHAYYFKTKFLNYQEDLNTIIHLNPSDKEVTFNPKYEQLFAPMVGYKAFMASIPTLPSCLYL